MDFIHSLVDGKYRIFNVNENKCPINRHGSMMSGWGDKSVEELVAEHNYNSNSWGINLGEQPNGEVIMSLDYDCNGCEKTVERYAMYLKEFNTDGNYKSSTDGNGNVLINITASTAIKDCIIKNLGTKNKFNLGALEVIVGKNQVIPPTRTICKKTKQMGQARQFKNPEKPFCIVEQGSNIERYILNLFEEKFMKTRENSPEKVKKPIVTIENKESVVDCEKDKHLDLLFGVIRNDKDANGDYYIGMDDWLKIAGILKSNKYGLNILQEYTGDGNPKTKEIWDGLGKKSCSIYGLNNVAKQINPTGYRDWLQKWNQLIPVEILEKGEKDIADFIKPFLINELKYSGGTWWNYDQKKCIWSELEDPTYIFTDAIQDKINETWEDCKRKVVECDIHDKEKMEKLNKLVIKLMKFYNQAGKGNFTSQVKKYLMVLLLEEEFEKCLDCGLYRQAYRNGMLDLKNMEFREGLRYDDFVSSPLPFDYRVPTDEEQNFVGKVFKRIANCDDSHLNYLGSVIGYSMTGDSAKEQLFFNIVGATASNGKSLIMETLTKIMPQNVNTTENTFLDKGADIGKNVCAWKNLKLLWVNELTKKKKDAEVFKSIADGTQFKYKQIYKKSVQNMNIGFKFLTVSNHSLEIDADEGIKRRLRTMEFTSQFKAEFVEDNYERREFKADTDLMNKLTTQYRDAVLHFIYQYSQKYYINKKLEPYPIEWKEESDQVIEDNEGFKNWFDENCEIGENLCIHKKTLEDRFKTVLTEYKLKDEVKKFKCGIKYDSQRRETNGAKRLKGFWVGFGLKNHNMFGEEEGDQTGN